MYLPVPDKRNVSGGLLVDPCRCAGECGSRGGVHGLRWGRRLRGNRRVGWGRSDRGHVGFRRRERRSGSGPGGQDFNAVETDHRPTGLRILATRHAHFQQVIPRRECESDCHLLDGLCVVVVDLTREGSVDIDTRNPLIRPNGPNVVEAGTAKCEAGESARIVGPCEDVIGSAFIRHDLPIPTEPEAGVVFFIESRRGPVMVPGRHLQDVPDLVVAVLMSEGNVRGAGALGGRQPVEWVVIEVEALTLSKVLQRGDVAPWIIGVAEVDQGLLG